MSGTLYRLARSVGTAPAPGLLLGPVIPWRDRDETDGLYIWLEVATRLRVYCEVGRVPRAHRVARRGVPTLVQP